MYILNLLFYKELSSIDTKPPVLLELSSVDTKPPVFLELSGIDAKPPPALYFSRMGSGAGYYYSGLGGEDCYYLVLGDSMKVQGFIDQTVDILQERVSLSTKLMFSSLIV